MAPSPDSRDIIHATTVSIAGRGATILGPSGSGKSALALRLIALGARLVADDRTVLSRLDGKVIADVPDTIAGRIEARGVGLLDLVYVGQVPVALVIDLSREETERLPEPRFHSLLGVDIPCLYRISGDHFPAAILLWLSGNITPQP